MLRLTNLAVLLLSAALPDGDDKIFSGPQSREELAPVTVQGFSGPLAGKEGKLLVEPKDTPRVLIFVHDFTRPALQLVRPLDLYAKKLASEGLETNIIWLSADRTKAAAYLEQAKGSLALQSPVVISVDGIEGPGNYGLNRKVALTILVAKGDKVAANFAIVQPNETDAPKVGAAIAKLMGKQAPTLKEMRGDGK